MATQAEQNEQAAREQLEAARRILGRPLNASELRAILRSRGVPESSAKRYGANILQGDEITTLNMAGPGWIGENERMPAGDGGAGAGDTSSEPGGTPSATGAYDAGYTPPTFDPARDPGVWNTIPLSGTAGDTGFQGWNAQYGFDPFARAGGMSRDQLYDYEGTVNQWWLTTMDILTRAYYEGKWRPDFLDEDLAAKIGMPPQHLFGAGIPKEGEDAQAFDPGSPQLNSFIFNYVKWALTSERNGDKVWNQTTARLLAGPPPADGAQWAKVKGEVTSNLIEAYVAGDRAGVAEYLADLAEANPAQMERLIPMFTTWDQVKVNAQSVANQHEQAMLSLAASVAQFDAELAAQPRNWIQYGAWLRNSGQLVNGLTLAMAAREVPDDQIAGLSAGDSVGDMLNAQTKMRGGSVGGRETDPTTGQTVQPQDAGTGGGITPTVSQAQPTAQQPARAAPQPTAQQQRADAAGDDVSRRLTAYLSNRPTFDIGAYQQAASQLQTTSTRGPTNALGINVGETRGGEVHAPSYFSFTPGERELKRGLVESVRGRGTFQDFEQEIETARPKGNAQRGLRFA